MFVFKYVPQPGCFENKHVGYCLLLMETNIRNLITPKDNGLVCWFYYYYSFSVLSTDSVSTIMMMSGQSSSCLCGWFLSNVD